MSTTAALAAAGVVPAAGLAADACPNAEIRQQQGATRLPECRAYEQVSPVQKNGNAVLSGYAPRASGGAFVYASPGAFSGALSSVGVIYRAERGAEGWHSTALNPPLVGPNDPNLLNEPVPMAISGDFSRALFSTTFPIGAGETGTGADLYLREPNGAFRWTSQGATVPAELNQPVIYNGASGDLGRILFSTQRALAPEVPSPQTDRQLYEWVDGEVRLVSKDANGAPLPGGAAVGPAIPFATTTPFRAPHAVSADGRTIFLTAPGDTTDSRVYVRVDGGPLVDVGVSQKHPPDPDPRLTVYQDATPDGAKVLFSSPDALVDGAIAGGFSDHTLYLYDVATGALTNASPYRNPSAPPDEQALGPRVEDALGIAADGSRAYFRANGRLVDGVAIAASDERHLYRYDAVDDRVAYIGTVLALDTDNPDETAMSRNGRYLLVHSTLALGGGGGAGVPNLYVHDAVAETTTCVTCPAGFVPFAANGVEYSQRNEPLNRVTDDGHVFFTTESALVPEDVNGVADPYMWHDGELHLLSSGIDAAPSLFVGATPDAQEAYFLTNESLVGRDTDNGVADLYVARVGGGFPEPISAPDCVERCRQPSAPPAAPPVGSATLTGAQPEALPPRPSLRVTRLSRSARARLARGQAVSLAVRVNRPGTVRLIARARVAGRTRAIARTSERASKAGTERLRWRLSRAARARLARGKALHVTADVRFTGVREPRRLSFTLRPSDR